MVLAWSRLVGCFEGENAREHKGQHLSLGSVHDLETPASPLLAFTVALLDQVMSLGDSGISR